MRNAGLDEAQARIKISGRNINNFRYADDTALMAEKLAEGVTLSDVQNMVNSEFKQKLDL